MPARLCHPLLAAAEYLPPATVADALPPPPGLVPGAAVGTLDGRPLRGTLVVACGLSVGGAPLPATAGGAVGPCPREDVAREEVGSRRRPPGPARPEPCGTATAPGGRWR